LLSREGPEVFYRSNSGWGAGVIGGFTIISGGTSDIPTWALKFELSPQIMLSGGRPLENLPPRK